MVRNEQRSRDRRRRQRRKYGKAKLKHSKRGIISCGISVGVVALCVSAFMVAYKKAGHAAMYIGGLGVVAMILTGIGLYMGIRGFKERNKNYRTCLIGTIVNGLFLLGMFLTFCRGLF